MNEVEIDADGQPKPFISIKHWSKKSMNPSKEVIDGSDVIALADLTRIGDERNQLQRMKNNRDLAMLEIKVRLKELRSLIYNLANNIAMMIVDKDWQRLTNRDAELVLNNQELSEVIAHKLISSFPEDDTIYLGVQTTEDLVKERLTYLWYRETKETAIEAKITAGKSSETEKFIYTTTTKWCSLLPKITLNVLYIK